MALAAASRARVYSPRALVKGQVNSSDLNILARGIYDQAHAVTARDQAEAAWRFFLTDGRFVKPGFWYHIADWAYEEPAGEVVDPARLLDSYVSGCATTSRRCSKPCIKWVDSKTRVRGFSPATP